MARFEPGRSGNPGGRPAGRGEAARIARSATAEAVFALARVACDTRASPALQRRAALDLLRIGYGAAILEGKQGADGKAVGRWPRLRTEIRALLERHEAEEGTG